MNSDIHIAILNITRWQSEYSFARCFYGKLILCSNPDVTFHNIRHFDVTKLGEGIEMSRQLTRNEAVKFDKRDGNSNYTQCWDAGERTTLRFEDDLDLTKAGITIFNELKLDVPFISVLEGKKYSGTHILNENDVNYLVRYRRYAKDFVMYFFSDQADEGDREIAGNLIKHHGNLENILNSDWVRKMQEEYDRMELFETDD